jgi:hypothetical protein
LIQSKFQYITEIVSTKLNIKKRQKIEQADDNQTTICDDNDAPNGLIVYVGSLLFFIVFIGKHKWRQIEKD